MPIVSVIIPSYNHETYIAECLSSVLNQTFQDFEIIITDDASTDRTTQIIEKFNDRRIKLFKHSTNKGASAATNNCIRQSNGKYIAMLSSDDTWYPNKLEIQVKYLDAHPEVGAVFGKVDWIDETGTIITSKHFPYKNAFNVNNRTRFEWLNYFFYKGNCLCHPCSLVRRECYDRVGLLNPAFASIPDFDLWTRICLHYEIYVLDQRLIRFRRMSNESNASGDTHENRVRNRHEHRHILNHYLNITRGSDFKLIFPDTIATDDLDKNAIHFLMAQLAIKTGVDYKVLWGLDVIYSLLQEEKPAKMVEKRFNFKYRDYIKLTGKFDVFRITPLSSSASFHPPIYKTSLVKVFFLLTKTYLKELYKTIVKFSTSN